MIVRVVDKRGRAFEDERLALRALGLEELYWQLGNLRPSEAAKAIALIQRHCDLYSDGDEWVGFLAGGAKIHLRRVGSDWSVLVELPFEDAGGAAFVLERMAALAERVRRLEEEVKTLREVVRELERRSRRREGEEGREAVERLAEALERLLSSREGGEGE
jgi:DNA-binding transcriptional MerR regulator